MPANAMIQGAQAIVQKLPPRPVHHFFSLVQGSQVPPRMIQAGILKDIDFNTNRAFLVLAQKACDDLTAI